MGQGKSEAVQFPGSSRQIITAGEASNLVLFTLLMIQSPEYILPNVKTMNFFY